MDFSRIDALEGYTSTNGWGHAGALHAAGQSISNVAASTTSAATLLPLGEPIADSAGGDAGIDTYTLSAKAGRTYMLGLEFKGEAPNDLAFDPNTVLQLRDPGDNLVALGSFARDSDGSWAVQFDASVSGDFKLIVDGLPDGQGGTQTVNYDMMVMEEFGDTPAEADAISPFEKITTFIHEPGDRDVFAVELTADGGAKVSIKWEGLDPGQLQGMPVSEKFPHVVFRDGNGNAIESWFSSVSNEDGTAILNFSTSQTGTYTIDVGGTQSMPEGMFSVMVETDTNTTDLSGFDPLDALDWATYSHTWTSQTPIKIAYVDAGQDVSLEGHTIDGTLGWSDAAKQMVEKAFGAWSDVIDLTFAFVSDLSDADFAMVYGDVKEMAADALAFFDNDGSVVQIGSETLDFAGACFVNAKGIIPDAVLAEGGLAFETMVHEIGHGLGLAHPHDAGGGSTVMPGVFSTFDDYGLQDVNQAVNTIMSYNAGWRWHPERPGGFNEGAANFGHAAGPMALDIAALQERYGANTSHASGDDVYTLPTLNGFGTGYSCIWDTGGTDAISAEGATGNAVIDLGAASLKFDGRAGGAVSYAGDVLGGYTIAAGVEIENAIGGDFDDFLDGNAGANRLSGGDGNDDLFGKEGDDVLEGGAGTDLAFYNDISLAYTITRSGTQVTVVHKAQGAFSEGTDRLHDIEILSFADGDIYVADLPDLPIVATGGGSPVVGSNGGDILTGSDASDTLGGSDRAESFTAGAGNDVVRAGGGADTVFAGAGNDQVFGGEGDDLLFGGDDDDTAFGGTGDDQIYGGTGNDVLGGGTRLGAGADTVYGGAGDDRGFGADGADLGYGGTGNDVFYAGSGADTLAGGDGADALGGGGDADALTGGAGDDTVYGGAGDDTVFAGSGADLVYGGTGDDVIYLGANDGMRDVYASVAGNGSDIVYGFENGIDRIDLTGSGLTGFAAIAARIGEDASGNATIDLGDGNLLTLFGIAQDDLDQNAFQF